MALLFHTVSAVNAQTCLLTEARFGGKEIQDEAVFAVGLELFHYNNIDSFLGLDKEVIEQRRTARIVTGNIRTAIEEYFREHNALRPVYEKRTEMID